LRKDLDEQARNGIDDFAKAEAELPAVSKLTIEQIADGTLSKAT
jgi:hypothetical protein